MNPPAGWYPVDDGLRYWDGWRWTEHVGPASPAAALPQATIVDDAFAGPDPAGVSPDSPRASIWFGWGGLGLLAALGLVTSGASGLLVMTGLYVLVVAVVAVVRGRVAWARLPGRAAGGLAAGTALGLVLVGGAMADPQAGTPTATTTAEPTAAPAPPPAPSNTPTPTATPTPARPETAEDGTALAAVAGLTVKGRAPKSGYSRDLFGQAWFDADRNGCDTRNDVLRRDLIATTMKNSCKVLAGTLDPDPYTGSTIRFEYGGASEIDVDHVIALSDAWQKGAQTWSAQKRLAFANDPLNLLAVDAATNRSKGDGDTATWLPPNKPYRCTYVARQVSVKSKYDAWVTSAERDAMIRVLSTCATTRAVSPGPEPTTAALPKSRPKKTTPAPKPPKARGFTAPTDTYFENCTAVRAAGADPIRAGQPGYSRTLDRDGDGVACE